MKRNQKVLVTGAGGFIGHHLVKFLKAKGYFVRGVDIKNPEFEKISADEFLLLDLRDKKNALKASFDMKYVYNLAANMGGIGFIESVHADLMRDNVLIDTNMLEAARLNKVKKFFYSSSACIYPVYKQKNKKNPGLKEEDAYPADPDNSYGWEKLFIERICADYMNDHGLQTRVARFHNVYGPLGAWQGGREKSPAAICRKIALAKNGDYIEVWGNGKQTRSYCYIDDCLEGIYKLMMSDIQKPLNIGSNRLVSINQLIDLVAKIAGKKIKKKYDLSKPRGVQSRNSDNSMIKKLLGWEPSIPLETGLEKTYHWIKAQIDEGKFHSPK